MTRKHWHTDEYIEYLSSPEWQEKRKLKLALVHSCEKEGPFSFCSGSLQVHHKSYTNLGNEQLDELAVLCEQHHKREHRQSSQQRREKSRRNKAFNTWMTKRYSDDWEEWADNYLIKEERERFKEWLDEDY